MNIQWGLKCPLCDDVVYSNSRHDWESCLCGALFIDGGWDYTHAGGPVNAESVSREVERKSLPWYYHDEPERARVLLNSTQKMSAE